MLSEVQSEHLSYAPINLVPFFLLQFVFCHKSLFTAAFLTKLKQQQFNDDVVNNLLFLSLRKRGELSVPDVYASDNVSGRGCIVTRLSDHMAHGHIRR